MILLKNSMVIQSFPFLPFLFPFSIFLILVSFIDGVSVLSFFKRNCLVDFIIFYYYLQFFFTSPFIWLILLFFQFSELNYCVSCFQSLFLVNAFMSINFSLITAVPASHRFLYVMLLFSLSYKYSLISAVIFSFTHTLRMRTYQLS